MVKKNTYSPVGQLPAPLSGDLDIQYLENTLRGVEVQIERWQAV